MKKKERGAADLRNATGATNAATSLTQKEKNFPWDHGWQRHPGTQRGRIYEQKYMSWTNFLAAGQ